jgi:hypothetical protein
MRGFRLAANRRHGDHGRMRPRHGFFPAIGAAVLLAAAALSACGGDGDNGNGNNTPGSGNGTPTATTPGQTPGDGGSPTPANPEDQHPFETPAHTFEKDAGGASPALLQEVRAARNEGFDRVVFEFEGDVPGYTVEYVQSIEECGSGNPMEFGGAALLSVTIQPANAHTEAGEATVEREISPEGTAVIREVKSFCDFEALVGWGVSLAGARPFRVFELQDPPRLVVDVAN